MSSVIRFEIQSVYATMHEALPGVFFWRETQFAVPIRGSTDYIGRSFSQKGNAYGMDAGEVQSIFKETNALRSGHFELRSGLHSNQYFQCALLLQHPDHTGRLCAALVEKARKALGALKPDAVMAPALGGITVGYEIARLTHARALFAEKQADRLVLRRGFEIQPGQHTLVAEDVITRGGRVQEVMDIIEQRGGIVDAVLVLVDRSGGKATFSAPVFSLLQEVPETWAPDECPLCKEGLPIDHPGS